MYDQEPGKHIQKTRVRKEKTELSSRELQSPEDTGKLPLHNLAQEMSYHKSPHQDALGASKDGSTGKGICHDNQSIRVQFMELK